ncbi:OmpA family protein, partial [Candidatus Albibeggiatoa sp. nov. BB20]|uniref:OmpA family protein n=1 Tax=Candidatus Albibeggiatoa sp. nov. BB20 TaxID=3162723 RepID=UPI0033658484
SYIESEDLFHPGFHKGHVMQKIRITTIDFTKSLLISLMCLFLLQACGGIPDKNQLLEQARTTYAKAESMPSAAEQKYTLAEAKIALKQAEQSQNERDIQEFARIAIEKSNLAMAKVDKQPKKAISLLHSLREPTTSPPPSIKMESYKINNGMAFVLPSPPLFDENQKKLEDLAAIQQIAQFLQKYPKQQALIEGHTAARGSSDFNDGLSYRQANSVRFALMRQGIASNRLIVKGLGSSQPIANNRLKNPRIQVTVSNPIGLAAN